MSWRHKGTEGKEQAAELLAQLQDQAPEVRKLTHSLRAERDHNHLAYRLRLAMQMRDPHDT